MTSTRSQWYWRALGGRAPLHLAALRERMTDFVVDGHGNTLCVRTGRIVPPWPAPHPETVADVDYVPRGAA